MLAASLANSGTLTCPECGTALALHALDPEQEAVCPGCRLALRGQIFRRWGAPVPGNAVNSERALEGDAVCFFHTANRAALACDACGRFLCTICDLQIGARHLCPACLSSGLEKEKLPEIVPRRILWSPATFWLGILPLFPGLILWPILIMTGPVAIIIGLVGWKRPGSLVRGRRRWMAVVGIILAIVQIIVWFGIIMMFAWGRPK